MNKKSNTYSYAGILSSQIYATLNSMYVAVDIGGTKTLVATIDDEANIVEKHRFPTPKDYEPLLHGLRNALGSFKTKEFTGGGIGVPGSIDREKGVSLGSPNVGWGNVPLRDDASEIFGCPFVIENDANMAALSEAMLHKECETVLYFTVSTGIGTGFIRNQQIDPALLKSEGGHMRLPHNGKLADWEDFASGRAIVDLFGKKAEEITDEEEWRIIAGNLSLGFFEHIAILQPNLIIVGGAVGTHFEHYGDYLTEELKKFEMPIIPIPSIIEASRPEEAVLFGCYDLAKQRFADGSAT